MTLLHRLRALEEACLLESEVVRLAVVEMLQQPSLEVTATSNVERLRVAKAGEFVHPTLRRSCSFDFFALHLAPSLGDWHTNRLVVEKFKYYLVRKISNITIITKPNVVKASRGRYDSQCPEAGPHCASGL